jgi:PKD repeat protein
VINFSGAGTTDPDNNIVSYVWDFGDPLSGGNSATGVTAAHTYNGAPGVYTATLTVTDAQGNVRTATQAINVTGSALPKSVSVASMAGSWARMTNVEVAATATIRAVNQYGQPLRSVAVYVTVSGSVSGKSAAKTDANGYVTIQMPKQRTTKPATYTFTVTSLVFPAYPYNPSANLPASASVTISR